jgi:hypothetical protein
MLRPKCNKNPSSIGGTVMAKKRSKSCITSCMKTSFPSKTFAAKKEFPGP